MSNFKTVFDQTEHTKTVYEESADQVTLTTHQDAQPILDRNAYERNSGINDPTRTALGRKVASIPLVVWSEWMKQHVAQCCTDCFKPMKNQNQQSSTLKIPPQADNAD